MQHEHTEHVAAAPHGALAATSDVGSPPRYSIELPNGETIRSLELPIITVEDHRPEGGLGEAAPDRARRCQPPPVVQLAGRDVTHAGKPAELQREAEIDADGFVRAVRRLVQARGGAS